MTVASPPLFTSLYEAASDNARTAGPSSYYPAGIDDLIAAVAVIAVIKVHVDIIFKVMLFDKTAAPGILVYHLPYGIKISSAM
jgi:hypothetical protein